MASKICTLPMLEEGMKKKHVEGTAYILWILTKSRGCGAKKKNVLMMENVKDCRFSVRRVILNAVYNRQSKIFARTMNAPFLVHRCLIMRARS